MDNTLNNVAAWLRQSGIVAFRIVASDRTIPVNQDLETVEKAVESFSGFYLTLADGSYYIDGRKNGKDQWSKSVRIPFVKGNVTGSYQAQGHGIGSTNQTTVNQPSESYSQKLYEKLEDKYEKLLEKNEKLKDDLQEQKDKRRDAERKNKDTDWSELMKPEAISAIGNVLSTLRGTPARMPQVGTMDGNGTVTAHADEVAQQVPVAAQLKMQRIINAAAMIESKMQVDMCFVLEKLADMAENDPAKLQMALQFLG